MAGVGVGEVAERGIFLKGNNNENSHRINTTDA